MESKRRKKNCSFVTTKTFYATTFSSRGILCNKRLIKHDANKLPHLSTYQDKEAKARIY